MAFQFPIDKLGVVNSALTGTGDNLVNVAEDGSDEWNVSSSAYETALAYIMESHQWGFSTLVEVLNPSPTPPQDTQWDTAYAIPADCIHIIWVRINQDGNSPLTVPRETLYDILGTPTGPVICINAQGGPPPPDPPATPAQVTIRYVSNSGPLCDAQNGTPTMILALQSMVMSGIYRGLHEDATEGDRMWAAGLKFLQEARTRYDQQKPKRQFFNSRYSASRRMRRPWPSIGIGGWGGGGPG